MAALTACTSGGSLVPAPEDPYAALRGIVLADVDLAPRSVTIGAPISLPRTGPAYLVEPARTDDLRALAERYAGGAVTEGLPPGYSTEMTGFGTGDGWFTYETAYLNGSTYNAATWGWTEADWRVEVLAHPEAWTEAPCGAPRDTRTEQAVSGFFERVGLRVELDPPLGICIGGATRVDVSIFLADLPLLEIGGTALVDASGTVLEAGGGPLWRLTSIGDVELAPSTEVLRRLVQGPGLVRGDCYNLCRLDTDAATLGLAYATTGGVGSHDHNPGAIVDDPPSQVLVPALRVPAVGEYAWENHQGVLAVSSALLVDDPAQADAARQADATSSDPAQAAMGCRSGEPEPDPVTLLCTSQPRPAAGTPVLLTAYGERYAPVGASDCRPLFTLDPGDGTGEQSFLPRSGTLITARVAHAYTEAGTYTVVLHGASRCATPASPGGTEGEYDYSARITLTVTD